MDKEKDVFQAVKEEPKTISLSMDEYKNLVSENAKFKAQVEMYKQPVQKQVAVEIEQSHVRPPQKQKRGLFPIDE